MAALRGKFESTKQDWETPAELFKGLDDEFHFTLDAAASAKNTKVPRAYFSKSRDGLRQDWGQHLVWINPPYGDRGRPISAWVRKAYEASLSGATVVLLIPARTNTNWFHSFCLAKAEVRFLRGRPKFSGTKHGLPQPLCLIVFRPPRAVRKAA